MKKTINIVGPMELNKNIIDTSLFTLIIDGGINHQIKFKNSISMGDQDSAHFKLDQIIPQEKDYSDLSYGLRHIPEKTESINCYGFIGGRLDHQLCIIGDILDYVKTNNIIFNLYSNDSRSIILIPSGTWSFTHIGSFSVLTLKEQKLKLVGDIKYKLSREYTYIKPLSSHGLSNESYGVIEIINEHPLGLFLNVY